MAKKDEFAAAVVEQMERVGPVSARAMFGGHGVYLDGLMFGLMVEERLYFKADDGNRADFEKFGLPPFTYLRGGKDAVSVGYFEAPAEVFEDKDEMLKWARSGYAAALRSRKPGKARPAAKTVVKAGAKAKAPAKTAPAKKAIAPAKAKVKPKAPARKKT